MINKKVGFPPNDKKPRRKNLPGANPGENIFFANGGSVQVKIASPSDDEEEVSPGFNRINKACSGGKNSLFHDYTLIVRRPSTRVQQDHLFFCEETYQKIVTPFFRKKMGPNPNPPAQGGTSRQHKPRKIKPFPTPAGEESKRKKMPVRRYLLFNCQGKATQVPKTET